MPPTCVGVPSKEVEKDDKDRDWMTDIKPEMQRPYGCAEANKLVSHLSKTI